MKLATLSTIVLIPLTVAISGCGNSEKSSEASNASSIASVQRQIEQGIMKQLQATLKVSCPTAISDKKGAKFQCVAQNKTTQLLAVDVTRVDAKGNVSWKMNATNTNYIEEDIRVGALKKSKSTLAILCPDVIALQTGATFECQGMDDKNRIYPVTVTQKDASGDVTWEFDK